MKLFELLDSSMEDQLKKTGAGIADKTESPPGLQDGQVNTAGGLGPDGEPMEPGTEEGGMEGAPGAAGTDPLAGGGMGGDMGGGFGGGDMNAPESPMQTPEDPEKIEKATKEVDDALFSQVKNLPFAVDFDHKKPKVGPYDILQMDNAELAQTRNIVKNNMAKMQYTDRYGLYDDPGMKYYTAMLSYVEAVINAKNQLAKASRAGIEPKKATKAENKD